MKHILLLCFAVGTLGYGLSAQEDIEDKFNTMEDKFDDAFEEEEGDQMTLRFFNAEDGEPVPGAQVIIDEIKYATDYEGKVRFPKIEKDGNYPAKFSCEGFISAVYEFEVRALTIFRNRFSVSPILDIGSMRIVLDWSRHPRDLDAHLMNKGKYHISYRNDRVSADGTARLDRDDRNGFGPETITINDVNEDDNYSYLVFDYINRGQTNSRRLSKSEAVVRVYVENRLAKTINIKENDRGTIWKVFTFRDNQFIVFNEIVN
ncbi:MAG: hypothetical protein U9N51_05985 [Bacteroidota bacterium]|nr:hypothetical protein [Bacteroidota bacterium]